MTENKPPFAEGAFIHRPPIFSVVNYQFWKMCMNFFVWNQLIKEFGMLS